MTVESLSVEQETNEKEIDRAAAVTATVLLKIFTSVFLSVGHLVSSLVNGFVYNMNLILFKA